MKRKVVFILGPTGSGKTAMAVKIAKKFNGEIISADSRQVYKGLDVGTGKDLSEYGRIKFYLIDVCEPEERFTLFDWLDSAKSAVDDILNREKLPIVVGGTGLYAKALAEGFSVSKKLKVKSEKRGFPRLSSGRLFSREELDEMPLEKLQRIYSKLQTSDSRLDINNPRRLIRAIEKAQTGEVTTRKKPNFESLLLAIDLPREALYDRIDKRVDIRFAKHGMLEEVAGLVTRGISRDWLKSLGLEYRKISEFVITNKIASLKLAKTKSEEFQEMAQELKWKSHAYARRQLTWLRKQPGLVWINSQEQAEKLIADFLN